MRRYRVTFHKLVPDGTGHDHWILQRQSVVRACSEVGALYAAKALFCRAAGIADWRMRADTCDVVALPEAAA